MEQRLGKPLLCVALWSSFTIRCSQRERWVASMRTFEFPCSGTDVGCRVGTADAVRSPWDAAVGHSLEATLGGLSPLWMGSAPSGWAQPPMGHILPWPWGSWGCWEWDSQGTEASRSWYRCPMAHTWCDVCCPHGHPWPAPCSSLPASLAAHSAGLPHPSAFK